MKRTKFTVVATLLLMAISGIAFFVTPRGVEAQTQTCQYQSTQVRVQPNRQTPLSQSLNLKCGESFIIGTFHNNSDVWATDTVVEVSGPGGFFKADLHNNSTVTTDLNVMGAYYVTARTLGQSGDACKANAYVYAWCDVTTPKPTPGKCQYDSIQARVKLPGYKPWVSELTINQGEKFEVGEFFNNTGNQLSADQVKIVVIDPQGNRQGNLQNNQSYTPTIPGTYTVRARIKGLIDEKCQEDVLVHVQPRWSRPTPENR